MVFLPDQGVDFDDLDFVQLLDSRLDLVLIALDIDDEDQGVVVLNLLHSTLSGVWVLDDVVSVQVGPLGSRLPGVLGRTGRPEGAGAAEVDGGPGLLDPGAEAALDHLLLGLLGLLHLPQRSLLAIGGLGSSLLVGGALRHWLGASLGLCCNVMKEIASDWE